MIEDAFFYDIDEDDSLVAESNAFPKALGETNHSDPT